MIVTVKLEWYIVILQMQNAKFLDLAEYFYYIWSVGYGYLSNCTR